MDVCHEWMCLISKAEQLGLEVVRAQESASLLGGEVGVCVCVFLCMFALQSGLQKLNWFVFCAAGNKRTCF